MTVPNYGNKHNNCIIHTMIYTYIQSSSVSNGLFHLCGIIKTACHTKDASLILPIIHLKVLHELGLIRETVTPEGNIGFCPKVTPYYERIN